MGLSQSNQTSFKKGMTPWNKGKLGFFHHTDEHKKQISLLHKGKVLSEETKRKIGLKNSGKKIDIKCIGCSKIITLPSYIAKVRKFCSRECVFLFREGKNHPNYKGGFPNCLDCGKQLTNYNAKRCQLHSKVRELHPQWIEDRTQIKKQEERNNPNDKQWKYAVYKRDNFKCKIGNSDCNGRIEAHHILSWRDYPELRFNINNGITLCLAHHPRKRAEEKRLSPYFMELVSVSKI